MISVDPLHLITLGKKMVMKGGKWQRAVVKESLVTFLSNEALLREGKMNIDREGKVDSLRLRV